MRMLIDSIRFQNKNHYGGEDPIIAEIELLVDDLPDFDSEGNEISAINFPPTGIYYVSLYVESKNTIVDEEWQKHYFVSKGGLYDYIYNGWGAEDDPGILEKYDRIVDAEESAFIDYFLLLDEYLACSRESHLSNVSQSAAFLPEKAQCSIAINSTETFKIVTRYDVDNENTVYLSLVPGYSIETENGKNVLPKRNFSIYKKMPAGDSELMAEFPFIENAPDKGLFRILCGLEKFTEEEIYNFMKKDSNILAMSETERQILGKCILEGGFGEKNIC